MGILIILFDGRRYFLKNMACVKNRYVIAENSAGLLCYTNRIMSLFTRIKGPCHVL